MEYITAKTIVTRTKNENWFGSNYNMNIYRGCSHGCIYCDSRSECYHVEDFDRVRSKENATLIIRNDLKSKTKKGVIATGSMSDPYNPFEKNLNLTRESLKLINEFAFGAAITTKSPLITRDIDILKNIKSHSPTIVKMTITTYDDILCKKIEQNVAPSSERFNAIKELSSNGIFSGVLLMPILPFINDNEQNILNILHMSKKSGAKFVFPYFGITLRNNQRDHFYKKIDSLFPGMKNSYISKYGNTYSCLSPNAKKLYRTFSKECEKLNLLYKMKDIIKAYKYPYEHSQISFFD